MLTSIETHITCDFPVGSGPPIPPLDPHLYLSQSLNSSETFFDISVNTDQIGMGFEADTREKLKQLVHLLHLSDKDLVKDINKQGCWSITFLPYLWLKVPYDGHVVVIFLRYICFKPNANLTSMNWNIGVSYLNWQFFDGIRQYCSFEVMWKSVLIKENIHIYSNLFKNSLITHPSTTWLHNSSSHSYSAFYHSYSFHQAPF